MGKSARRALSVAVLGGFCACAGLGILGAQGAVWKPVSFAILEDYDKGDDLREVEEDFRLFQALEISTWRGSFGWDDYEPSRRRLDLDWLHRFVELAERNQIRLRPYVGYTPEWAARAGGADTEAWNNPPRRPEDWEWFASSLANALARHPNVLSYEIFNEQNARLWWDGSAPEYADALARGAKSIRGNDSDAQILFGGLVFPDIDWIERVCSKADAARAFSVLPVHAYPETWTPAGVTVENYLAQLPGFVAAADEQCGRKSIWINETGFATIGGRSEMEQAYWWVRAVATFLASPRVEHIGVYEIKDLRSDRPVIGDTPNYHLGLTRSDRTPKLAFYTVDLLTDLLDTGVLGVADGELDVSVQIGAAGELHHHLFRRPDERRVLIVWDRTGTPTLRIRLPEVSGVLEYGVDGRPVHWDEHGSTLASLRMQAGVPRIFLLF